MCGPCFSTIMTDVDTKKQKFALAQGPRTKKHKKMKKLGAFLSQSSSFTTRIFVTNFIVQTGNYFVVRAFSSQTRVEARIGAAKKLVSVRKGDLTNEDTEAIVNAANSYLKHGGGLARAISLNGGPQINEESQAYIKKHGPIRTGEVGVTSGGNLKAK